MHTRLTPFILSFLLSALVVWTGCSTQAQPAAPSTSATPVRIAEVKHELRSLPIRTSGRLAPKTTMQLSFKTGGLIHRILVDEGDHVPRGQLLAQLDLSEIEAEVEQARSAYGKAERDAERMTALYRDSVATLEQLQNAQTALEVAQSRLRIATFNRQHSEIHAPADGRILQRQVETNELISSGEPVLTLGATTSWVVRVGLADRDVVKLRLGDDAHLHFDAYPERRFDGQVSQIAEAADPLSGMFEVEITVADPEGLLKTGFIAKVDLFPASQERLAFVPIEALVEGDGRDGMVYALDTSSNVARRVHVQIAHLLTNQVAISSGLEAVSAVVTEGAAYLSDSTSVEIARD